MGAVSKGPGEMDRHLADVGTERSHRKAMIAAIAIVGLAVAYGGVLIGGLASIDTPGAPIEDPWFTILEILIIAIMPAMVMLMAAIHAAAPGRWKLRGRWALNFMIMAAVMTMVVHASLLILRRTWLVDTPLRARLLSFEWPSVPYAFDIVAWDILFALAVLLVGPLFIGSRLANVIRLLLIVSGLLALAGLAGPLLGDMRLRNIGVVGYAGVFPVAVALMVQHFRKAQGVAAARNDLDEAAHNPKISCGTPSP